MEMITTVSGMQAWSDVRRAEGRTIALVPTMGALHEGHLALVRRAAERCDDVIVSIFVNPTQFGPDEDFDRYPRDMERDTTLLSEVDSSIVVYAPGVREVYPDGPAASLTWVEVERLDRHLCGQFREGHFRGVTTVVTKLLLACKPDEAFFGLKDAQQFVIIERMVRDLQFDVEIVGVPIVREEDGLAASSRNAYLTPSQRASAPALFHAVRAVERQVVEGEQRSEALVESMRSILQEAEGAEIEYAEVVDAESLEPVDRIRPGQDVLAAVAVYFGDTRLIDNVFVRAPEAA